MDLLRDLLKINEGFDPDFNAMSDGQLMDLCMELEIEDLCELDDDGKIANREELIRDLEAGHGEIGQAYRNSADTDTPPRGEPMECVVMDGDKKVKEFDTIGQARDYVKKNKDKKLVIKEARHLKYSKDAWKAWKDTFLSKKKADAGVPVMQHRGKPMTNVRPSMDYMKPVKESTEVYANVIKDVSKLYKPVKEEAVPVVKFKQPADGSKKPALPAHGGYQKDVKNKTAAQAIEDEIGDAGMKGMKKKDRPYMEKPRFRDWLTANMYFNMTKSGELAGEMKLTEGMPAGVIRQKQKISHMSAQEAKEYFKDRTREQVERMERSHCVRPGMYTKHLPTEKPAEVKEDTQRIDELKVPSKLKRFVYGTAYETQPEKVIKTVKGMSDREVDSLHSGYEKQGEVKGRVRGSPQDIQKRALRREHAKRKLALPTIDSKFKA